MSQRPLISVIIPCYNQAHFLAEAIESVLAQDYAPIEIVVVNDGSSDGTEQVATRYAEVTYISQANQGLSAARNTGLLHSSGDLLVFLDADDRLLPGALTAGYGRLQQCPDCAFVYGHYRYVDENGRPQPTWRERRTATPTAFTAGPYELIGADGAVQQTWPNQRVCSDHYAAMLQRNVIVMHATVLYRRWVFDEVGLFDPTLRACEDYDLYLRITRRFPVAAHEAVVADYRLHGSNMTGDAVRMLTAVSEVMARQRPFVQNQPLYAAGYAAGLRHWQDYYGKQALRELPRHLLRRSGKVSATARAGAGFLQRKLSGAAAYASYLLTSQVSGAVGAVQRKLAGPPRWGALANGHGAQTVAHTAADGYTADFLQAHAAALRGVVLLDEAIALPATAHPQRCDRLAAAASPPAETYDAVVLGRCWLASPDFMRTLPAILRALKPNGVLLAALPGVVAPTGGRGLTTAAAARLFADYFAPEMISIVARGNVQTATAVLHQIPAAAPTLTHDDPQFPVIIAVRARKT